MDSFWALIGSVAFGLFVLGVLVRVWYRTHPET